MEIKPIYDVLFVVAAGNIFDGITIYGTFDSFDLAEDWAYNELNVEWWVSSIEKPA
jgi:hypothetical protein